jgi:hypothetical protein
MVLKDLALIGVGLISGGLISRGFISGKLISGKLISGGRISGGADLSGVDLHGADLRGASLYRAYLCTANLTQANFTQANLRQANLTRATLPEFQLCSQENPFTAYKKVHDLNGKGVVLELEILGDRTSNLVGRKCRASKVRVIKAIDSSETEFVSTHDKNFRYTVGAEIECKDYNSDIRIECTSGIHFFMTQEEAAAY